MNHHQKPADHSFWIGELCRRSAVAVPNIRYYEEIGILPKAP
jgi:DNA-binding transcriptional MerR regulator